MSTSRRSSKSTKSTATTRSARPPTWRATSLISGTSPGPPLIVSKNSAVPEVSIVFAEPETVSSSASSASKLVPAISNRSRVTSSTSAPAVERKNSTRIRVQDVFSNEDLEEGGSNLGAEASRASEDAGIAFPSISSPALLESTNEDATPQPSSSPGRASWFGSFGRSKGKEKAAGATATSELASVQDTPKATVQPLDSIPIDGCIENNEALSNAIDALGSTQPYSADTIRASLTQDELETPRAELPSYTTSEDLSKTVRASERPKQSSDPRPSKHTWFNPFAPYPSQSQNTSSHSHQPSSISTSLSTSPTSPSPLSRASSSYVGSVDDEVPGPVRTPIQSDDEDGQKAQTLRKTGTPAHTIDTDYAATSEDSQPVSTSPSGGQTLQPRRRLDSLNSLNPSTSRFSISLPLLGRPKMRLEDAVKRGKEAEQETAGSTADHISEVISTTEASSITETSLNPSLSSDSTTTTTAAGQPDSASPAMSTPPAPTPDEATNKDTASLSIPLENGTANTTQSEPSSLHTRDATNASWWSYIGWNTSQHSVEVPPNLDSVPEARTESVEEIITQLPPADSLPERSASAPPALRPSDNVISAPAPAEPEATPPTNVSDMPSTSLPPTTQNSTHGKAPSIFSFEAARAAGSWFSPWAWYGYETTAATANDTSNSGSGDTGGGEADGLGGNGNGDDDDDDEDKKKKEMTESEKIKEAALARDRQLDTITPSSEPPASTQGDSSTENTSGAQAPISSNADPMNPIADSASSLRSGWASFFSLSRGRGLVVKNLEGTMLEGDGDGVKRDENGMEVMDLDDDEGGSVNMETVVAPESEKAVSVTKIPASTAISLMQALVGHDAKKMIESKDEKGQDAKVVVDTNGNLPRPPPSPQPPTKISKEDREARPDPISVPGSPTKPKVPRHGRAASVSTTKTNTSSAGNKTAPPLTISDDLKASVAAAKKAKRAGDTRAPPSGVAGPSSLPKDGISTPPSDREEAKKDRSKPINKSGTSTPHPPPPPNIVLPSWEDTFHTAPRCWVPEQYLPAPTDIAGGFGTTIGKTMRYMSGVLLGADSGYTSGGDSRLGVGAGATKRRTRRGSSRRRSFSGDTAIPGGAGVGGEAELIERERKKLRELINWGQNLPRAWDVINTAVENRKKASQERKGKAKAAIGLQDDAQKSWIDVTRGCKRVVIIGVHGWFPGAIMRSMLGEPTGTSPKFANMMEQALEEFQSAHGVKFDKITKIPLEGEGTINGRVEKLYTSLLSNESWMDDLHNADVIFVATHSQGSIVSTHLLDRLIRDRHIRTTKNAASEPISDLGVNMVPLPPQRVCCLALCGIHLGPLRYLSSSSLLQPYIQYLESSAAKELFTFQNSESDVSKAYVQALQNVLYNETKMVYVASLNDQVVPIYSGLFTSASHPLILRGLYIDGDAYNSSDFLTNLLVLLLRVLNCGLSDSGLLAHLSEVTAGSLNGIGHSTAYEELSCYSLAVNYLFLTNIGFEDHPELTIEPFNASNEMNDYEIPWALRDLIADERVTRYFSQEITQLRDAFRDWHPKTTISRDIKRKLQPIQRLPVTSTPGTANSASKL